MTGYKDRVVAFGQPFDGDGPRRVVADDGPGALEALTRAAAHRVVEHPSPRAGFDNAMTRKARRIMAASVIGGTAGATGVLVLEGRWATEFIPLAPGRPKWWQWSTSGVRRLWVYKWVGTGVQRSLYYDDPSALAGEPHGPLRGAVAD